MGYNQDPHLPKSGYKQKDNYKSEVWLGMGLSHALGSPAWGFCTEKMSPQNVWLWRSVRFSFGRGRGPEEIDSTLKECTQSLTSPGPRAEAVIWKEPGQTHLLMFPYPSLEVTQLWWEGPDCGQIPTQDSTSTSLYGVVLCLSLFLFFLV